MLLRSQFLISKTTPSITRFPRVQTTSIVFRSFSQFPRMSAPNGLEAGKIPPSEPGEQFEPRQTAPSEDYTPDPSKSIALSPARQSLVDDIIALYSCEPTIERVKRYTPDCVYDDQFVYANDRYKMAGQWFALPKLFKASKNEGYEIVKNDEGLIQFRNAQVCCEHVLLLINVYPLTRFSSHGPSRSSPRRRPSTPSCHYHLIPRPSIPTSFASSITRTRRMTRTIRMRALASASRSGRRIR